MWNRSASFYAKLRLISSVKPPRACANSFSIGILSFFRHKGSLLLGLRVGQGWDIHRLVPGRPLIIGGERIASDCGLLGHSDADVLLHAIIDSLLGAAALGDIGRLFPDNDAAFENADSRGLLRHAYHQVTHAGYIAVNIDATIIAEAPKMAPYIPMMLSNIADDLALSLTQINIKAKSYEGLGEVGCGQAIMAQATCLLSVASGHGH